MSQLSERFRSFRGNTSSSPYQVSALFPSSTVSQRCPTINVGRPLLTSLSLLTTHRTTMAMEREHKLEVVYDSNSRPTLVFNEMSDDCTWFMPLPSYSNSYILNSQDILCQRRPIILHSQRPHSRGRESYERRPSRVPYHRLESIQGHESSLAHYLAELQGHTRASHWHSSSIRQVKWMLWARRPNAPSTAGLKGV